MTGSTWYHVICRHKPPHTEVRPARVCVIEDDGGAQASFHDKRIKWLERSHADRPARYVGVRLRIYNADIDPLTSLRIADERNREGHEWTIECGICGELVKANDENLARALIQIRQHLPLPTGEMTLEAQHYNEQRGTSWTTERVPISLVPLTLLQNEVSNPGVSRTRAERGSS